MIFTQSFMKFRSQRSFTYAATHVLFKTDVWNALFGTNAFILHGLTQSIYRMSNHVGFYVTSFNKIN
jgi:hypothetical protein